MPEEITPTPVAATPAVPAPAPAPESKVSKFVHTVEGDAEHVGQAIASIFTKVETKVAPTITHNPKIVFGLLVALFALIAIFAVAHLF